MRSGFRSMSGRACRMDVISNLGLGFSVALTIQNIAYCFIGALLGTLIGVLPGIGPVTTVAMLLPVSFTQPAGTPMTFFAENNKDQRYEQNDRIVDHLKQSTVR